MMDLNECLTEDSEIFLIGNKRKKRRRKSDAKPNEIFHKSFNHAEFIGEELCAIKNIRCTHYFLVGIGEYDLQRMSYYGDIIPSEYDLQIATLDFKRPNREYKFLREYNFDKHTDKFAAMLQKTKDKSNEEKLCLEMLNLIALDMYMGQADRYNDNIMFEKDKNGNIRLAPLYDFERSLKRNYLGENTIYESELFSFPNIEACEEFIKKYPIFREILSTYLDIDLLDVIERAYNRRNLIVPESKWKFYSEFEKDRKKVLRKIIDK